MTPIPLLPMKYEVTHDCFEDAIVVKIEFLITKHSHWKRVGELLNSLEGNEFEHGAMLVPYRPEETEA